MDKQLTLDQKVAFIKEYYSKSGYINLELRLQNDISRRTSPGKTQEEAIDDLYEEAMKGRIVVDPSAVFPVERREVQPVSYRSLSTDQSARTQPQASDVKPKEKVRPFVLFFDRAFLEAASKRYGVTYSDGQVFVEGARRQDIYVKELGRDELAPWHRLVADFDHDEHEFRKNVVKTAILGAPGMSLSMPMHVARGLNFHGSTFLFFHFSVGLLKASVYATLIFPETSTGKDKMFRYFKTLASEDSVSPIAEKTWKNSEKMRDRMSENAPYIEGFEKNLWESHALG
jgi:hypothetical protein